MHFTFMIIHERLGEGTKGGRGRKEGREGNRETCRDSFDIHRWIEGRMDGEREE